MCQQICVGTQFGARWLYWVLGPSASLREQVGDELVGMCGMMSHSFSLDPYPLTLNPETKAHDLLKFEAQSFEGSLFWAVFAVAGLVCPGSFPV